MPLAASIALFTSGAHADKESRNKLANQLYLFKDTFWTKTGQGQLQEQLEELNTRKQLHEELIAEIPDGAVLYYDDNLDNGDGTRGSWELHTTGERYFKDSAGRTRG